MHAPRRLQLLSAEGQVESPSWKILEFENPIPFVNHLVLANPFSGMDPWTLLMHDNEPTTSSVGPDAQKKPVRM